jgi:hypothetical protein
MRVSAIAAKPTIRERRPCHPMSPPTPVVVWP